MLRFSRQTHHILHTIRNTCCHHTIAESSNPPAPSLLRSVSPPSIYFVELYIEKSNTSYNLAKAGFLQSEKYTNKRLLFHRTVSLVALSFSSHTHTQCFSLKSTPSWVMVNRSICSNPSGSTYSEDSFPCKHRGSSQIVR